MIKIEDTEVIGFNHAIRGMRNPMNSWDKSDSDYCYNCYGIKCGHGICEDCYDDYFEIGDNDFSLMQKLAKAGTDHRKFMRMIVVYTDVTSPLYWWKEYDTYKVGTVANSCSTMHKIHEKEFELDDFSHEHLDAISLDYFRDTIRCLNFSRSRFEASKKKEYWWQMIQMLPTSFNQKRTLMLNYEVLANIYMSRKTHKLDEWVDFCGWIESLPYSELITGERNE